MPWLDLVSRTDWCSMWYISNGPTGQTSSFDGAKPTVLFLHPDYLDTTWLRAQLDDTRLREGYNLVAMDARCHGRTKSTPSGRYDTWVAAADVAFFCHRLRLPPLHVFAAEGISVYCALRFAALFPEMVLSLTLCQVPPPEQIAWSHNRHVDLAEKWCAASDLVTYEDTGIEFAEFFMGEDTDPDLKDEILAFYQRYWSPTAHSRAQEFNNVIFRRTVIEKFVLDAIVQPTLIIQAPQGQWSKLNPLEAAENMVRGLVNVEGGARLYTVQGGKGYMTVVPSCATIVNQTFSKFLSSLPHHRSDTLLDYQPLEQRMAAALAVLAEMTGDPEIATRDPRCPLSFSMVSTADAEENMAAIHRRAVYQVNAFSALGPDGWPVRVYSQRPRRESVQIELVKGAKPRPQPFAFGVIPIGPTLSRFGMRRTSDQDIKGKIARTQERGSFGLKEKQQKSTGGGAVSGDVNAKLGRGRRGTDGPDPMSRVDKPVKGGAKKPTAASTRFQG